MDVLLLARLQFAATTIYHFFFVPLTLGLSVMVAVMETMYVRSGDELYKRMTLFWGKLFLINFAMGVVTGIVQEFQFGMNWSQYSRFVGDIFGAPLAMEALLAFYLESTFLGVWFFGWNKLSRGAHLTAAWLVAIAANVSALWILIANSFMQQPMGYTMNETLGRAEMNNFFALLGNPNVWVQWPHVFASGVATGAFFILGVSAWHLLRKQHVDFFKRSFQMALVFGLIGIGLVIVVGHAQAQHMVATQPMKMAAAEALWNSEDPASFSLLTIGDLSGRNKVWELRVPGALSLLAYNQLLGEVKGINDLQAQYSRAADQGGYGPGDYVPPIPLIYWSFRLMVGAGFLMLGLVLWGLYALLRGDFTKSARLLALLVPAMFLPYIANTSGWLMTELGRQPWIVFGLLRTQDAVSPASVVPAAAVAFSLAVFVLIYAVLMAADLYLLNRFAKKGPAGAGDAMPVSAY